MVIWACNYDRSLRGYFQITFRDPYERLRISPEGNIRIPLREFMGKLHIQQKNKLRTAYDLEEERAIEIEFRIRRSVTNMARVVIIMKASGPGRCQ